MTFVPSTDIRRKAWQKAHPDGSAEDMEAALEDSPLAKDEYSALAFIFCGTTTTGGGAQARGRTRRAVSARGHATGRKRPGIEKSTVFNYKPLENHRF